MTQEKEINALKALYDEIGNINHDHTQWYYGFYSDVLPKELNSILETMISTDRYHCFQGKKNICLAIETMFNHRIPFVFTNGYGGDYNPVIRFDPEFSMIMTVDNVNIEYNDIENDIINNMKVYNAI